jgi:hypothetical protein
VGAIDRGRIPPSQTIPDHMDYPADHTPVVHARNATRPREKGLNALELSLSQPELIRHRQVLLPRLNRCPHQMESKFAKICCADKPERDRLQPR